MERATNAQMDSQATELIALTLMNVNKEGLKFENNISRSPSISFFHNYDHNFHFIFFSLKLFKYRQRKLSQKFHFLLISFFWQDQKIHF